MQLAYKILTETQFAELQAGRFAGAPVDLADGFVHLSTAEQLTETADRHFAGQTGLVVAAIDLDAAGAKIRWEVSRGGAKFPHLYGRLGMELVVVHAPLRRGEDGEVMLPESR